MSTNDLQDVFLGRQPILDRAQQLVAYELLFRDGDERAHFADGNLATATVIRNAFTEFSMAAALGPYQAYIKVDSGLLCSDLIEALPAHCVILEIVENVAVTPELTARCAQLRAAGFTLALQLPPQSVEPPAALLEFVGIVKIDPARADASRLAQRIERYKAQGKTTVAEKVESEEQMQSCRKLGFDLFQGYYFARPTLIQGKHLHPSELSLLRLIWLLSQDADDAAIETVFRKAPLLTVNLLRLINSAGNGVATRVSSLRHAISLIGRRQLLRWLQLMLYSGPPGARPAVNPLLQLAATRGRRMELLAERSAHEASASRELIDQAYMVGILSLMPALFGSSMSEVLVQLPVTRPVHAALDHHDGMLGDLLTLVEWLEIPPPDPTQVPPDGLPDARDVLRRLPEIDSRIANSCLSSALNWANNLAREAL